MEGVAHLQVSPGLIFCDVVSSMAVKSGVQRILPRLPVLETLHLHKKRKREIHVCNPQKKKNNQDLWRGCGMDAKAPPTPPYLISLAHVAVQQAAHALDSALLQLVGAPLVITNVSGGKKIAIHFY